MICILVLFMACILAAVDDSWMQELYNTLWYVCILQLHGICLGALLVTLHQLEFTIVHFLISTTYCQTLALLLMTGTSSSCLPISIRESLSEAMKKPRLGLYSSLAATCYAKQYFCVCYICPTQHWKTLTAGPALQAYKCELVILLA